MSDRSPLSPPISITTRMRIEHGHTIKEGHNYTSTVEVTYTASEDDLEYANDLARDQIESQLEVARKEGARERDARNKADGR